jgi:molybdopterin molybdotransferase
MGATEDDALAETSKMSVDNKGPGGLLPLDEPPFPLTLERPIPYNWRTPRGTVPMASSHAHSHDRHAHRGMPKMPDWLSVEEARDKILSHVNVLDAEDTPLLEALGQVLAVNVQAGLDVPSLANSSMDGYAVQAEDIREAGPTSGVLLQVVDHVAAGQAPGKKVGQGQAIRIMTGAPIPEGANTVVPFEETDELHRSRQGETVEEEVRVMTGLPEGSNIREAGEDIRKGDMVLGQGTVLRPAEIGVLASLGFDTAPVVRRPVVGILATGDELVEPPASLRPEQVYNSNTFGIAASVLRYGGIPRILGIARDNLSSLEGKIAEGLDTDLLITTAGVSRGDYDIVKDVLMKQGEIAFWTVRMKPAKPIAFGTLKVPGAGGFDKRIPHLGLPGNPVSAMVAFEQFGRPALLKMMGRMDLAKPTIEATLEDPIENHDERRVYARAWVTKRDGRYYARLTGPQGSGVLTSMAKANGLAICPEDVPLMPKGSRVTVEMLDWSSDQS